MQALSAEKAIHHFRTLLCSSERKKHITHSTDASNLPLEVAQVTLDINVPDVGGILLPLPPTSAKITSFYIPDTGSLLTPLFLDWEAFVACSKLQHTHRTSVRSL